ncbi:olfactory receptor 10A7-like [Anomaloglossus baeobatrachus]|uniref:olfactory receptor 10A7-like n=1 Tax=Anomaloglossus baeobatrachus TaxID=238106 RepID=UPI003F502D08
MCDGNQTEVTEFLLLGFKGLYKYKYLLFIIFLFSYLVIMNGNLLIIVMVSTNHNLNIPMFIFLKHLAVADILLTTTIVPMMLNIILFDIKVVPLRSCIIQLFFFFIFGFIQSYFITIMSYDRYLAICSPMHYNSIMQPHVCLKMVLGSWFIMFVLSLEMVLFFQLDFCGQNVIDHFFCDSGPLLELTTSDTSNIFLVDSVFSIILGIIPFTLIITSYLRIFFTVISQSSTGGRGKAFSTCSSHVIIVCTYYGTLMMVYMAPSDENSLTTNKFMSLLYIVVTPMMNPIIYSLRNQEIRKTIKQMFKKFYMCKYNS